MEDILDIGKFEEGQFKVINEEFKILRLLKEIHSIFHTQMLGKGLKFNFKEKFGNETKNLIILTDKKRLK